MKRFRQFALGFAFLVMSPWPTLGAGKGEENLPPPYIFNLGRLSPSAIEKLKKVPGVEKAELQTNGRIRVVLQPINNKMLWVKGANDIYEFLTIKERVGKTQWTHGGGATTRAGTVIQRRPWDSASFVMHFRDATTGRNNMLNLDCFNQAKPEQVKHEMLRFFVGKDVSIEKCGNGYVLVKQTGFGPYVVWQVNDQMFVEISQSYDKKMVAAYIDRLGCITKKGINLDMDKWIENEIRWRIEQYDDFYLWRMRKRFSRSLLSIRWPYLNMTFYVQEVFPALPVEATSLQEWKYLHGLRRWLWANRKNFKYHARSEGFLLKGKDRYDPKNPPALPDFLRDPPKPAEVRKPTPTKKPAPAQAP